MASPPFGTYSVSFWFFRLSTLLKWLSFFLFFCFGNNFKREEYINQSNGLICLRTSKGTTSPDCKPSALRSCMLAFQHSGFRKYLQFAGLKPIKAFLRLYCKVLLRFP